MEKHKESEMVMIKDMTNVELGDAILRTWLNEQHLRYQSAGLFQEYNRREKELNKSKSNITG
jgi:hypothetical protein